MNGLFPAATSLTTPVAKPQQPAFSVEESRDKRLQRQQARFRDRGGIYVPKSRDTLLNILLKGGKSPSKEVRSRSRSRSKSPVKSSRKKRGDEDQQERGVISSQAKSRRKSLKVDQTEEVTAGPSRARSAPSRKARATTSRAKAKDVDAVSVNAQTKSRTATRKSSTKTSKGKGKERERPPDVDEELPKSKRTRTSKKAVEADLSDGDTAEDEYNPKKKTSAQPKARKASTRKKALAKSRAKAEAKDSEYSDEHAITQTVTSKASTRKPKGRSQAQASANINQKARGRGNAKASATENPVEESPTKDAQQGAMATSLMHEKRRADKARLKCGVLSDIEEEEEPVSRRSGARHASNRGNRDEQSPSPGPNETPLVASRTGGTAATLGRKRKQGETPPENAATLPASGVSRKKLKVDNGSNSEEEAVRSKAPEEITGRTKVGRGRKAPRDDTDVGARQTARTKEQPTTTPTTTVPSPSSGLRKRKLSDTGPDEAKPAEKPKANRKPVATKPPKEATQTGTEPDAPAKKKAKTTHSEEAQPDERLKTTSRTKKENSRATSTSQPRRKAPPKSKPRTRGPPKEVLEQITKSKPHVEDGEPDELDFLS